MCLVLDNVKDMRQLQSSNFDGFKRLKLEFGFGSAYIGRKE